MVTPGASVAALSLLAIVRDFDKLAGFGADAARRYVDDEKYKKAQIEANWADWRKVDPTWGNEKGRIEPAYMVIQFERRQLLDRSQCQSYEAYMLQYLAWLFDISSPQIVETILRDGGPQIVMDYLRKQLANTSPEQLDRIEKTFDEFVKETKKKR